MKKIKVEFILIIILIPILAYVGWQAYNTYLKPPAMDLEELELPEEPEEVPIPAPRPEPEEPPEEVPIPVPKETKGTLDYTGYAERDPLKHSLPFKIKEEKPPVTEEKPEGVPIKEKEPPKEIILPKFIVTGIVWGKVHPRAIIDDKVYKIGDIIKEAKILDITEKGIHMIYQGKEFWIAIGG